MRTSETSPLEVCLLPASREGIEACLSILAEGGCWEEDTDMGLSVRFSQRH